MTDGWRTSLVVRATALDGRSEPVVVGLVHADRHLHPAIRVGQDGDTLLLSPDVASQLIVNLRTVIATLYKREGP